MTTELTLGMSVEDLVALYEQAEADISAGFARIAGALAVLKGAVDVSNLRDRHRGYTNLDFDDPSATVGELRREVWRKLVDRTQVRKAMSIAAWKELNERMDRDTPLPITVETVSGMVRQFRADVPSMLEAAVHEVFDFLRPQRSEYKTNTEFEIGERVILRGFVSPGWWGKDPTQWHVADHWYEQRLLALENVFMMLDGRVRTDADGILSLLSQEISRCKGKATCHGATTYFEFRGHKNRTLHLKFRRMDLVQRLNAVAGGARLKPPAPAGQDARP